MVNINGIRDFVIRKFMKVPPFNGHVLHTDFLSLFIQQNYFQNVTCTCMCIRVDQFRFFEIFKQPHVACATCASGGVKITCSNSEFF